MLATDTQANLAAPNRAACGGSLLWMKSSMGARIAKARLERNLSQAELARRLGVSRSAVSLWEIDQAKPEGVRLAEVARCLDVSTDHLLGLPTDERASRGRADPPSVPVYQPMEVAAWAAGGYVPLEVADRGRCQTTALHGWNRAIAMPVQGPAMTPDIPAGAVIVLTRDGTPRSGDVVVVDVGRGAPIVRTLVDEGSGPVLVPTNSQFPVVPLPAGSRVVGRVVEIVIRRTL